MKPVSLLVILYLDIQKCTFLCQVCRKSHQVPRYTQLVPRYSADGHFLLVAASSTALGTYLGPGCQPRPSWSIS